ncbi:glycosyltransferase family 92 protein [Rhizobium pisi]|uniref:glycosyltransferase family 92 protein n=1 Tax=Rhizobium pisi TaxID=574561 RepID=UPI0039AE9CFD
MHMWHGLRAVLKKRRQARNEKILVKEPIVVPQFTATTQPDHYLSCVAIAKNEGAYLDEWIQFHLLVGISHFYIYDNGSTDQSLSVLSAYEKAGIVTVVPWRPFSVWANTQNMAYAHAVSNFGPGSRWMAFFDLDEFMFPVHAASLTELLQAREQEQAICVTGINFGTSGHAIRPEGLVAENYRQAVPMELQRQHPKLLNVKSIVQPAQIRSIESVHWFNLKGTNKIGVNEDGEPLPRFPREDPLKLKADTVRFNHYYTRSREEFSAKVNGSNARGPQLPADAEQRWAMFRQIEEFSRPDDTIQRFLPDLKDRLSAWQKEKASA